MRWKQSIVGEAAAADTSLQRPKIDGGGERERGKGEEQGTRFLDLRRKAAQMSTAP